MNATLPQHPLFLLAGGPGSRRPGPDPLLKLVFSSTGKPTPSIAYIGAASGDDPGFFSWLSGRFTGSGSGSVSLVPTVSPHTQRSRTLSLLEEADLIFISGGDVEAGMSALEKLSLRSVLTQLHKSGKPFFGLSAGSIMLSDSWVRWRDPDRDETAELFPCLGFAPILCDMHAEEDDWIELKALLQLHNPGTLGYGIPTGAGLQVDPNGTLMGLGKPIFPFVRRPNGVVALDACPPGLPITVQSA